MNVNKIIQLTIAGILASSSTQALAATHHSNTPTQEKCYGIVKAGFNDCQTTSHSCAGSSTKDKEADAFILLPKGICTKIVGGSLTSGKAD